MGGVRRRSAPALYPTVERRLTRGEKAHSSQCPMGTEVLVSKLRALFGLPAPRWRGRAQPIPLQAGWCDNRRGGRLEATNPALHHRCPAVLKVSLMFLTCCGLMSIWRMNRSFGFC